MFSKYKNLLILSLFIAPFCAGMSKNNVSECVAVSINDTLVMASQIGRAHIFSGFGPISLDRLVDFYALREKANKLSFLNPSEMRIDEHKKGLLEKLGLVTKTTEEIDQALKNAFGMDGEGLRESISDFCKVTALIETFVNARSSNVYKDDIQKYCNDNPAYTVSSFTVLVSETISMEKYKELRFKHANNVEFEKAIGINSTMEITFNSSDAGKRLINAVDATEIGSLSEPIVNEKGNQEIVVIKVLSKSPKRLLTAEERQEEVSAILTAKNKESLYEQLLADARRECAIQYNVPKDKI